MATLTAPIRWLGHTVRILTGINLTRQGRGLALPVRAGRTFRRSRKPPWPDEEGWGGVREPRRPRRTPPTGTMALPEPTGEQRTDLTR